MKAIFVPNNIFNDTELKKLNDQLKDCHKIQHTEAVVYNDMPLGTLLIVSNYTRKDKLKRLKKIANEGTNNNSI